MGAGSFDIVVIGSGPAGQKAAIQAAKLGKRVALIDRPQSLGGVCIHHGTIPSKTMREAILYFTGFGHREAYRSQYRRTLTMQDLLARCEDVVQKESRVVAMQLNRNRVEVYEGEAAIAGEHTVKVHGTGQTLPTERIIIATGTEPARPQFVPFEDGVIIDSNGLGTISRLPRSLAVIGAGVVGTEYASMMAVLDIEVTLIDQKPVLLDFVDREIGEALAYHMRNIGVILYLGEEVVAIEKTSRGEVRTALRSGKRVYTEALLYAAGRRGASDGLDLESLGIQRDQRGRILVNEHFQTSLPHIYAVGDVIGFPSLASTSMEQGRLAACHACGIPTPSRSELLPYGIYTIPEISMVGKNEKQLTGEAVPYEIGIARYREIARGQILGDQIGMLKLLFHPESRLLLGVHTIGQGATELIHIGQTVLAFNGNIDFFIENTFNYPTLAECYRVAALDGYNKVVGRE